MPKQHQGLVVLMTVLMAFLSACDSDDDDVRTLLIKGVATAEEPVEGAAVAIFTIDGSLIAEFPEETQSQGTFLVSAPLWQVKDGYRVEVTGGALAESGIPFTDTLRAVVDHDEREEGKLLHVGFVSTVLAGYMDRHPEMEPAEAEAAVAGFLKIPETQNLLTDLFFYQGHFSRRMFAQEAAQYGGLAFFTEMLLNELESGEPEGRSFAGPSAPGSFKDLALKPFVKGFVKGAGGEVGKRATGWVMDHIFGQDGNPEYPADPEVINAIEANGKELHQLKNEFEGFAADVKNTLEQILTQAEKNQYTSTVSDLYDYFSVIDRGHEDLWFIATHKPDPDDPYHEWESTVREFRNDNKFKVGHLEDILNTFHHVLCEADPQGAIDLWGFINTRYSKNQKNHEVLFEHFLQYASVQATTLNLILERRACSDEGRAPQHYVDTFLNNMEKQADVFLKRVEGMMSYAQSPNFSNHSYRDEWGGVIGGEFDVPLLDLSDTRESETLVAADTIAGYVRGIDEAITVRLAWVMAPAGPLFANLGETQLINKILEEYSPETEVPDDILFTLPGGAPRYSADKVILHHIDLPEMENLGNASMGYYWFVKRYTFASCPTGKSYSLDPMQTLNKSYPDQRAWGNADLFHPEYRKLSIPMETGKFHNMLVMTYAHPLGPLE